MTEFELATIEFQNATIQFQKWGVIGQYAIGLLQVALIAYGLRLMERGGARRTALSERQHEETMAALAAEQAASEKRHEETMAALAEERAASQKRHEEVMTESEKRHEEAMRKHDESMTALTELIRRTGSGESP